MGGGNAERALLQKDILGGKGFEHLTKFAGGESEWNEWSGDFKTTAETRSEMVAEALNFVKTEGKVEKEVMTWDMVLLGLKNSQKYFENEEGCLKRFEKMGQASKEVYRWLRLKTDGEAKQVVTAEEEEADGFKVWGLLHAKYNKRTMSRLMRQLQECMYPKKVKVNELENGIRAWEEKWKRMKRDQPAGTSIPDLWKMAAMLKICPDDIVAMVENRWDELGENYEVMKERIITWGNQKADKKMDRGGGAVPMDVDEIEAQQEEWWLEGMEGGGGGYGEIGAVYANTRCFNCQGFGHMARNCTAPQQQKGKGKGQEKGKGKGDGKGKGLGMKGDWNKGGWKGGGKAGGDAGKGGKGFGKSLGKGFGYQGTCHWCKKVGHKAAECEMYHAMGWVQEVEEEQAQEPEKKGGDVGGVWEVGAVEVDNRRATRVETTKVPVSRVTPKTGSSSGSRFMQEAYRKCGAACEAEDCSGHQGMTRPMKRTLDAWMPKRVELGNRWSIFGVDEEEAEEEMIGQVEEDIQEVVEVTIDSGAARSVWPRKKKTAGVVRRKLAGRTPKLKAANGTEIQVDGEAVLNFEFNGRKCGMTFLDSDVKKPLGAVSAMEDAGNTVVFSKKWGRYIENDETGERIMMERVNGTYLMKVNTIDEGGKKVRRKGREEEDEMDVDGMSSEDMEVEEGGDDKVEKVVFRRRMLD